MRPALYLTIVLLIICLADLGLVLHGAARRRDDQAAVGARRIVVSALGLTDLCVATEARYTRHPAVSDPLVPFMDHPGAIEHFPSGSFWAPSVAGE